jgi:hypothetical protein
LEVLWLFTGGVGAGARREGCGGGMSARVSWEVVGSIASIFRLGSLKRYFHLAVEEKRN